MNSKKLALGSLLMACTNVVKIGLQFVLVPVIARLVGPTEYGLFGLAMPVVMLVMSLADGGLGDSLAREKENNHLVWSSACWVLAVIACILIPGVICASYIQSLITNQPRLPHIVSILSFCLLFFIFSVPSGARLFRRGQLAVPAMADMVATIMGAVIAIVLAVQGAGVWSMVTQNLIIYGIRFFIQFFAAPYYPELLFSWNAIRPHLLVGGSIVGVKVSDLIERNIENMLIGRTFGTGILGVYTLANQIPSFIAGAIGNIVWVNIYARALHAPSIERQAEIFKKFFRLLALLLFPFVVIGFVEADSLVHLFLGQEWNELPDLLRVFLLGVPLGSLAGTTGAIFLANGKSSIQLRIGIETNIMRACIVLFAGKLGIFGCVVGLSLTTIYSFVRCLTAISKVIKVKLWKLLVSLQGIVISSLVSGLVSYLIIKNDSFRPIIMVVLGGCGGLGSYAILLAIIDRKHLIPELKDIWRMLKKTPSNIDEVQ